MSAEAAERDLNQAIEQMLLGDTISPEQLKDLLHKAHTLGWMRCAARVEETLGAKALLDTAARSAQASVGGNV